MEFGLLITPPAGQSSYLHEEEIWGQDPVHYTAKGYSLAAAGLESLVYEHMGEEKEAEVSGGQGPSKKPRLDPTQNRPSWVKGSVSEAVRRDKGRPGSLSAFQIKMYGTAARIRLWTWILRQRPRI